MTQTTTTPMLDTTPRNFLLDVAELYWARARETEGDKSLDPETRKVLVDADSRRGHQARDWALTFPAIISVAPTPSPEPPETPTLCECGHPVAKHSPALGVDDPAQCGAADCDCYHISPRASSVSPGTGPTPPCTDRHCPDSEYVHWHGDPLREGPIATATPSSTGTGEPKPCPFCGAKPREWSVSTIYTNPFLVGCINTPDCAVAPRAKGVSREQVIAAWNRRSAPPPAQGAPDDFDYAAVYRELIPPSSSPEGEPTPMTRRERLEASGPPEGDARRASRSESRPPKREQSFWMHLMGCRDCAVMNGEPVLCPQAEVMRRDA